ncbi:porin [Vibrio superstes]|uniref:Porin n=1 Tax=Vibrio superstes NBRC 103154 TaxID=1219062 RepID=A0A511QV97_9VIBR|nr:porin [Vibrio superstes]GEM80492.1 porin [Vibrio superstes NBRC 103154]
MKKTLLALAVASVAATSVNAAEIYKSEDGSVEFYGQLRQELKFLDSKDHEATLSSGSSRTGVKGSYSITDSVDVIGLVEIGVADGGVTQRQHYVGFAGDFGTFEFGKQWTISDDVYGADYSYFFGGSALRYATLSGALHESQIQYKFDGDAFWVKAAYGLNNDDSNQDLYEAFAGTSFGDLSLHVGAGYTGETTPADPATTVLLENTYAEFTAEYGLGDHLIGFTYYWAELANQDGPEKIDENGFSVAGIFQMMEKTALYAGYEFTMQEANSALGGGDEDGTLVYVGIEHKFNSWARIYGEYGYGDGVTLGYNNQGSDAQVEPQVADGESNFAVGARFYW